MVIRTITKLATIDSGSLGLSFSIFTELFNVRMSSTHVTLSEKKIFFFKFFELLAQNKN